MRYLSEKKPLPPGDGEIITQALSPRLKENITKLHTLLEGCSDAVFKEFAFGKSRQLQGAVIFFDGLVSKDEIELHLLKPLMLELGMLRDDYPLSPQNLLENVQDNILTIAEMKSLSTLEEVCHHLSSGDTILLIDGCELGLVAGTRSWQGRSVETPENELVIRGPREGFTETLRFNTALLRRRLKSTNFKIESLVLGRVTKTDVVLCYIKGIAAPQLVDEVRQRLQAIDIDGVLDSGYLEEFLEDHHWTIFPQIEYTEKPDRACGHLLEGQICIMVDGSPIALLAPTTFPRFWQAAEDYYERFIPGSLFRLLRFLALWIALLLPSLYIAAITYHQEMLPTALYLTIAANREGVSFPAFVEALIMELTFELLREAGIRLPRAIGPAVSIVGALIIGDAAVKAGLVSTPMVVVVAFTGIASFTLPSYNAGIVIRIARFGFLMASGVLGLLGIMIALLLLLTRMSTLSSLGVPYLSPLTPYKPGEWSDIFIRRPWFINTQRPQTKGMENLVRQTPPRNQ